MSGKGRRFALLAVLAACGALLCLRSGAGAGIVGSPHDFSLSKPPGYTHDSAQLAPNGVCSVCHIPHGAWDNVLWRRNLSDYSNTSGTGKLDIRDGSPSGEPSFLLPSTVQCYDCHDLHGAGSIESTSTPALSLFDSSHRPQNILSGFRKDSVGSMTEDGFGSTSTLKIPGFYETNPPGSSSNYGVNLSAPISETGGHYFKQDPVTSGGLSSVYDNGDKLPCTDCHDPHAWNSNGQWQAFIRETWPTGAVSGRLAGQARASDDMANAFYPSSPGRDNNASRAICAACHGYSNTSSVNFSDIQSHYRSVSIQGLPATIAEHDSSSQAACISCHVHNSIGANCSQCHGFPPSPYPPSRGATPPVPYTSGDPHGRHVGRNDGQAPGSIPPYVWECKTCHATSALGSRTVAGVHQDNAMSIAYDFSSLGVANPPNTVSGGGLTCGNVYCHSNGGSDNTMGGAGGYFRFPQWGTTASLRCNGCHGPGTPDNVIQTGMPAYTSGSGGSATANSHAAHVVTNRFDCSVCHFDTAQGNYLAGRSVKSSPLKHVNGVREVVFDGTTAIGGTTPYTGGTGNKRCAVSCHNSQTLPLAQQPQWGNPASSTCSSCHLAASADSDAYLNGTDAWFQDNAAAVIDNTEWTWAGHGRSAGNYDVSGRPAANLLGGGTGTNACLYCHDPNVGHKVSTNPFRLKQQDNVAGYATWGWNATCMVCHSKTPSPPGYDPDNTAVYANRVATAAFADNNHYGTRHGAGNNGGRFCWDCHDPHGDRKSGGPGNIFMIHKQKLARQTEGTYGFRGTTGALTANAPVFTNVTTGTNYADNTTHLGICQVCHLTTGHYTATSGDGHNAAKRCTDCHLHDAAFKGFGGPDVGQYFDNTAGAQNFDDRSSHPLRGLTTGDNSLRFGGSENCLACHYGSVSGKTTDECLMCHFENGPAPTSGGALGSNHMDTILQLANPSTAGVSSAPTAAYSISGINDFDSWCLLCHNAGSPPQLGGRTATGIMRKQYFADGEHRANDVGCIYCHHPHGRTNAKLARENPNVRRGETPTGTPKAFGVYPNEVYGGTQNVAYLADGSGRAYADNNTGYCNLACHQGTQSANKRKYVNRVNASGWYVLSGTTKSYVDGSSSHVHVNDEIINTDNIVHDYATMRGITGPSYYRYPGTSSAHPSSYVDNVNFPFYPDYNADGFRDFTNAYNSLGVRIAYRFTCSTCHDPHGTSISTQSNGTPDLRLRKNKELCSMCHK